MGALLAGQQTNPPRPEGYLGFSLFLSGSFSGRFFSSLLSFFPDSLSDPPAFFTSRPMPLSNSPKLFPTFLALSSRLVSSARAGPKVHTPKSQLAIHSVRGQRAPLKHFKFVIGFAGLSARG